ncbi:MAG: DUF427 domain-containing protein [Chloroflexi bacterium]|nr:DUF427 domain-containing protein [Chloroflexota bacterium]MDL1884902.1 DUF427 domain-containing protein [Anaerolineae bacterium CFX8]
MFKRIQPGAGQESVWDYPRPPRVEPTTKRIRVVFNGQTVAVTTQALRVLETSHPPVYYIPPPDVMMAFFSPTNRRTFCEFKGTAAYWTITVGERRAENAAWSYPDPNPGYEAIKNYLAVYPGKMDVCYVDDERVTAQEGEFYGGWITSDIIGPFKGGPGTLGW